MDGKIIRRGGKDENAFKDFGTERLILRYYSKSLKLNGIMYGLRNGYWFVMLMIFLMLEIFIILK